MMADGWKNLEFLSPTFNHNSLDFFTSKSFHLLTTTHLILLGINTPFSNFLQLALSFGFL